jgi:hypothetical protein
MSSSSSLGASRTHLDIPRTSSSIIRSGNGNVVARNAANGGIGGGDAADHDDRFNYVLLLALYTLQGIPMVSYVV